MKITLIALIATFISSATLAQDFFYDFSYFPAPYQEITPSFTYTALDYQTGDYEPSGYYPVGFTFPYYTYSFDSMSFHPEFAWCEHMSSPIGHDYMAQLFPFGAGYSFNDPSSISCTTIGTPGSRIFKAQWKNFGLDGDTENDNIMNLQMWLYEVDGAIEFRSGLMNIDPENSYWDGASGGISGLIVFDNDTGSGLYESNILVDTASSPTLSHYNEWSDNNFTTGCIPSNFVYRFVPKNAGVKEQNLNFSFYPNPATVNLTIVPFNQKSTISYTISDLSGKTILAGTGLSPDVSTLAKGSYLITVSDGMNPSTRTFVKQ